VIQFISLAEGLVHSVQLLCQLLSTIEPLAISEVIQDLKQTTLLLLNVTQDDKYDNFLLPVDSEVCYLPSPISYSYNPI